MPTIPNSRADDCEKAHLFPRQIARSKVVSIPDNPRGIPRLQHSSAVSHVPRRGTASNPPNTPAIALYLQDRHGSRMPQKLALRSTLPSSQEHQASSYHGPPPSDIGTSRLPARSDFTQNDSLPALTRASSSRPSQSVSDGMGERQMNRTLRVMVEDPDGALEPTTLPPFRRPDQDPVLECPFTFIKCFQQFSVSNEREWVQHSLEHFRIGGGRPKKVDPPKTNSCCFCSKIFTASSGVDSWRDRMDHVKLHHQFWGHRLAAARHDFALVEYLWQHGLLSIADYRELKPQTTAASRSTQNIPTPPDSPPGLGAVTVINRNQRRDGR